MAKPNSAFAPALPPGLERLLTSYQRHCEKNGLRKGSIELYEKICRWFLNKLADCGCDEASQMNTGSAAAACMGLASNYYLETVRTFLRYCVESGQTDRDYSYVVPPYKRPQPMPSVYSEEEMRRLEAAVDRSDQIGKRNYAIVLLATRLGLRAGDIRTMSFDGLDFDADVIRIVQEKTLAPLELPMVPELKAALIDYIENGRPKTECPVLFRLAQPPYGAITQSSIGACFRKAMRKSGIERAGRGYGPRAMRSSMASSMVNDNVPYDAVRMVLGHDDPNAISHYAKLDIEQLRFCALPAPQATGAFADFLSGRGWRQ
jgi:integrase